MAAYGAGKFSNYETIWLTVSLLVRLKTDTAPRQVLDCASSGLCAARRGAMEPLEIDASLLEGGGQGASYSAVKPRPGTC